MRVSTKVIGMAGDLTGIFNDQVARLLAAGLASNDELAPLLPLLELIDQVEMSEGRIPFLIVAQNTMTLAERMAKIELDGRRGVSNINGGQVVNFEDTPQGNYLALDVEDGTAELGVQPSTSETGWRTRRLGATALEGIMLATYAPGVLLGHGIMLPGSSLCADYVPALDRTDEGGPKLTAWWRHNTCPPNYGSMSCGRRLGLNDLKP